MKLEKSALIAEIIGSVAVIVTLGILILEVRENTGESRAMNRQSVIDDLREQLLVRAQSPSLNAILVAVASGSELTSVERSQYAGYLIAVMKSVEEAYFQYAEGRLDKEYLDTRVAGLMAPAFLGSEFGLFLYNFNKETGQITAAFAEVIDAQLALN